MSPLTTEQANDVYDVLVEFAGAPETDRDAFVYHQTKDVCSEYRFIGLLGFGGKFWNNDGWYVNCYQEHLNAERAETIRFTNALLGWLHKRSQTVTT